VTGDPKRTLKKTQSNPSVSEGPRILRASRLQKSISYNSLEFKFSFGYFLIVKLPGDFFLWYWKNTSVLIYIQHPEISPIWVGIFFVETFSRHGRDPNLWKLQFVSLRGPENPNKKTWAEVR